MEERFLQFLKEWMTWAEAGGMTHGLFRREYGLCGNCSLWDIKLTENQAVEDCFAEFFPFGEADYVRRYHAGTQHECPKRLAWVRAKIAELEKGDE